MGKRKLNAKDQEKKKKVKQQQDSELDSGFFNAVNKPQHEDWENEEQDYELKPRTIKSVDVTEGLPIKRSDGKIERVVYEKKKNEEESKKEEEESKQADETPKDDVKQEEQEEEQEEDEDATLTPQERLYKIKEEIADLASKLIEDPEENYQCFTRLRKMSESKNVVTSQLAIMALIPVFKSLAPTYQIRPLTDAEKREKVSKEVARLRSFEQALVTNYILYVDNLAKLAKVSYSNSQNSNKITPEQVKKGLLATKAACELCLSSLRHFNHRSEVFAIVIRRLNRKPTNADDYDAFSRCVRVLETLLKDDEENGDISHEVVRLLSKSIIDKKFRVDESVVNIFLSLSVLEDYDPNNNRDVPKKKIAKKDRVHLSKKERKARKERKEIEEEMRKAEQALTVQEREKFQAQVLKMLLTLYLQILKAGTHTLESGKNDATFLMAAVLEGLSRFGQMANLDLLGDFLEVLREIMTDIIEEHSLSNEDDDDETGGIYGGRQIRTVLLCVATSFTLLLNHGSTGKLPMSIDLSKFISSLYSLLADLSLDADLEFSHKSLRLADPLAQSEFDKPAVNVSTKAELLLRCLDFIFFRSKNGTIPRATSFTKRLHMTILHTPEKTSLALLKFIGKLTARYDENIKGLWNTEERISGEGSYVLGIERLDREVELERSNSGAATLWENVLLDKHYCPMVKDGSRSLMKNSKAK